MKNPLFCLIIGLVTPFGTPALAAGDHFRMELTTAHRGFDGKTCWVHARAGAIPAEAFTAGAIPAKSRTADDTAPKSPVVVMTMQKLLLTGSDIFYALNETKTSDLGQTWSTPVSLDSFRRQTFRDADSLPTGASIAPDLLQVGDETTVCDFVPAWHTATRTLLGIGQTVWYRNNRVTKIRPRGIAYAVYDIQSQSWSAWDTVKLPDRIEFQSAGAGSAQRVDLPGGDVMVPFYFKEPQQKQYHSAVCRCRFDGKKLQYVEHGDSLTIDVDRGLYEPSLTKFGDRYYLTLRNDKHGYVCTSADGLNFESPRKWRFNDGSELGNYNTQQHWVTHSDALFLVYTRRGSDNDHVFRHRSPLFIAQVDPEQLHVIRDTEQVLVPERGARTGNFGVVDVSPTETWVTVTEWMQPAGVEKHGSDNSVFVAKLKWKKPNALVNDSL